MAAVYSTLLIAEEAFLGSIEYTVSGPFVLVLRDVDVWASVDITIPKVNLIGSANQTIWSHQWSAEDTSSAEWRGRQVIPSGESFRIAVSGAPADITASGYLLSV